MHRFGDVCSRGTPIVLLLAILAMAASYIAVSRTSFNSAAAVITPADEWVRPDQAALDFGTVWATSEFPRTVALRNCTTDVIHIREVRAGCKCVSVEPASMTLRPGAHRDMTIVLDLSGRPSVIDVAGDTMGRVPFAQDILLLATNGRRTRRDALTVQGMVRHPLTISSREIRLVAHPSNACVAETLTVHSKLAIQSLRVAASHDCLSIRESLDNAFEAHILVTVNVDSLLDSYVLGAAGLPSMHVDLRMRFANQPRFLVTRVPVRITPEQFPALVPGVVVFNHATLGSRHTAVTQLRCPGNDDVQVLSVDWEGRSLDVRRKEICADARNREFEIEKTVEHAGRSVDEVTLSLNMKGRVFRVQLLVCTIGISEEP